MKCERCGEVNPAEIHTCTPQREPSGSWTSWDNTMCNPVADARMQTQSAWQDGYDSAKAEWQGLTDEEVLADDVLRYHFGLNGGAGPVSKKGKAVIAATEAKLKEKNT